jgi:hypothetical protein
MPRTKLSVLAITACLVFAAIPAAHAQVGGLIKKKVGDAVKGPEKPKEKAKVADTIDDDAKLPFRLDADSKKAFIAGLQVEIDAREAFRKRVASLKTPEQYEQCTRSMITNPEGQKFAEDYAAAMTKLGDNAAGKTREQIMKATQDVAEQFKKRSDALSLKYCGDDPTPVRASQAQVFERAERAGAVEFGKVFKPTPSGSDDEPTAVTESSAPCVDGSVLAEGDADLVVRRCHDADPGSRLARVLSVRADTTEEEKVTEYRTLKERIEKYCSLPQAMRDEAEKNGIRVPGQGQNIYWVFNRGFAIWVGPDCAHLLKLFSLLQ